MPGLHNLYNALSCLALLSEMRIDLKRLSDIMPGFEGIERRFDIILNNCKKLVIDDYAHNPHKISYLIMAVKGIREGACFIFQTNGYGLTRLMKDEYIMVFSEELSERDHLILLPIYYSRGIVQRDISSYDLSEAIKLDGKSVEVMEDKGQIFKLIERGIPLLFLVQEIKDFLALQTGLLMHLSGCTEAFITICKKVQ